MKFFKKILTPPVFDDEIKTQQVYILHIILWTLICVPIPFVIYTLTKNPEDTNRAVAQAAFGEAVNIILLWVMRRGYVKVASILQVSMFWLFFTATAVTGRGVQGEAYLLGYVLVISIAGILLGGRGALVFTALSLSAGAWMINEQLRGNIASSSADSPVTTWVVSLVLFPVGATLQYLASKITRNALARARASEERYRLISQVSSDYTFSTELGPDGKLQLNWVAGAFKEITGYTFDEYVATGGWLAHLHPDDIEKDAQDMATIRNNQKVVTEIRTYTKDRQLRWVRVYGHPVWDNERNLLKGIVGAVQDITGQKQAEEALRKSESIYRKAIEVAGGIPYHQTINAEGNIIYDFMGEGIREITGYGPEEITEKLWDSMVQERHLLEELEPYSLDEAIQQVRTGKIPIWRCEHCLKARDGKIHWVFEAAVDLRDEHGIAYGSIGMYQDITERKQSEEVLKYERDLLQIFMNNIPDTVYFKDRESRFVRVNAAQARFLNIQSTEDVIGKTDLDFQPPELAKLFMEEERRLIETGQSIISRIEFNPTRDGQARWLSATKVPVRDATGQVSGIIGISRDVTEQRLAQEYEQNRRAMLEKVVLLGQQVTEVKDLKTTLERIWHGVHDDIGFERTAIFLYDQETDTINGSLGTDDHGNMVEEWEYRRMLDHEKPTSFMRALEQPNSLFFTNNFSSEFEIPEGHEMYNVKDFASVSAWAGDKPVAIITVDNRVSGRFFLQAQLESLRLFAGYAGLAIQNARLNAVLEHDLAHRKTLIEELEAKNAELERFTYTVSHDLKSPLVTITGFLGYLEQDALSGNIQRVKSSLDRISNAAKKMQALLNDLLELSRIGRLMNAPEDVPFGEIVREAVDRVQGQLNEINAIVDIHMDFPVVRGDRVRLVEVVQNLVDNAAKYSNPAVRAHIEIGTTGHDEKGCPVFFVRDNGIGIEKQYHERIFGLFNKLEPDSEGTGIGLSLVKRIIEVHNGRIWVESEKGKGAVFYFSLPMPLTKE